jgi:glycosyltransferase involved in cell wall biosynthesis
LTRAVGAFRPDVIHAHFGWSGVSAGRVAESLRTPYIVAFHGSDVYRPGVMIRDFARKYARIFQTGAAFTCVGPRAGIELQRLGCPPDRLSIVPVGIDLEDFSFAPSPRDERTVLLQVGRLVPKKGVDTTLTAFAHALPSIGDCELWIAGDGPERPRLEVLAHRLGVAHSVRFLGEQTPAGVRELMGKAHIGVQPSRQAPDGDREGTPTVILEMQARGVDVAATDHADIPSIVPFPEHLVAEGDAPSLARELARLARLSDAERTARLKAARSLVERQHDARRIRRRLRDIYTAALAPSEVRRRSKREMVG